MDTIESCAIDAQSPQVGLAVLDQGTLWQPIHNITIPDFHKIYEEAFENFSLDRN